MATCPRCGKKMMQEAEACDLCWLKSDLSQAEKHIAELEIRAENAERKRDEAKARAATAEAARLDADLQVARDQKRIAELERERDEALAKVKELETRVAEDNAVCVCGCAHEDHESLGEDGEQCAHESDGHVCLRVAPAIRDLFVEMRERAEKAERERDEARKRVAELEAHLRKIHDRAHSWNSIPACSDIEQMAAQALGLKGGA